MSSTPDPTDTPRQSTPEPYVRVTSDGTPEGTHVYIDGKPAEDVIHVAWEISASDQAVTTVTFLGGEVDVRGRDFDELSD